MQARRKSPETQGFQAAEGAGGKVKGSYVFCRPGVIVRRGLHPLYPRQGSCPVSRVAAPILRERGCNPLLPFPQPRRDISADTHCPPAPPREIREGSHPLPPPPPRVMRCLGVSEERGMEGRENPDPDSARR